MYKYITPFLAGLFTALILGVGYNSYITEHATADPVGGFSDPFISLQLAANPQNGYILQTDGSVNSWVANVGGGGGGAGLFTYNSGTDTISPIIASTSNTAILKVSNVTATSTTATSTFPRISVTTAINLLGTYLTDLSSFLFETELDTESELEGQLTDVTNVYTNNDSSFVGNADTATALAANGANCSAGNSPLGVDASGAVESCFDVWTEAENTSAGYLSTVDISDDTNLAGDTEIVLTNDTLSIASTIARDSELHDAVTLTGTPDYITLTGQAITRNKLDIVDDVNGFTSANLRTLLSDETGTGIAYFVGGALGTPASGNGSNLTALNATQLTSGTVPVARVGAAHIDAITEIASALKDGTGACSAGLLCLGGHTHAISSEVSGLGTNVATLLGSFTSANFLSALSDSLDLGGEASFEIPNGANPTTDATGEIALDTTDNQLIVDDGTNDMVFRGEDKIYNFAISSTTIAVSGFASGQILELPSEKDGFEITQFRCHVVGGTSIVANISDGTNDTETTTCLTTVTSDTDVATNDTFTADEIPELQLGTVTGVPNWLYFTIYGRYTRE